MKQLIVILLALLLTGCIAESPAEVTDTQPQVQPTAPQDTTEPPALEESGTYFADSAVEARTDGAIRAFDVGINDCSAVYPMGDGILLFSGSDVTTLTVLTGEALCIGEQKTLECLLSPESGSVQIGDNGIAYFDSSRNVVIFLDTDLRETRRVKLPDIIQGSAVIAPDWSTVYYCTENAVNVLDMHTGLSRLLKEHEAVQQTLAGMYFDGSVLRCDLENEDQVQRTIYLSALTGETLYSGKELNWLCTDGDTFFSSFEDGTVSVCVTGNRGGELRMLCISQTAQVHALFELDTVVVKEMADSDTELTCLNMETGEKTSTITLSYGNRIVHISGGNGRIWMIAEVGNIGRQFLYCWDPAQSPAQSGESFYQTYDTAENPDTAGLEQCRSQADAVGEAYGVDILIGFDALQFQPDDYAFEAEYRVAAYERDLEVLESALARFPAGFFEAAAAGTSSGRLTISLVRSLNGGSAMGSLESGNGVQYWTEGSAYIALAMGGTLEQTFYHALCHVIDNRVISTTLAYDDWTGLNPEGFAYDYSYFANRYREGEAYLQEEDRAFIDTYSMSYPKEDRARILEYAMMPGNASCFTSDTMQNKLRTLCLGIREAFELDGPAPYPWEQYLAQPQES